MDFQALLLSHMQIGSKEELDRRRVELEQQRQQALQQMNQHRGSLGVVQQNTREAKRGLSDPRFQQIAERYRKQLVEVRLGLGVQGFVIHLGFNSVDSSVARPCYQPITERYRKQLVVVGNEDYGIRAFGDTIWFGNLVSNVVVVSQGACWGCGSCSKCEGSKTSSARLLQAVGDAADCTALLQAVRGPSEGLARKGVKL